MNVLGFDTSTAATAVCVERADGESFEYVPDAEELDGRPGHARELLPRVAAPDGARPGWAGPTSTRWRWGWGPGPSPGLRIGVATARSLAVARGVELRPVSSLAALAEGIEGDARACPVIDARRGEVFAALYEDGEERLDAAARTPQDAGCTSRRHRGPRATARYISGRHSRRPAPRSSPTGSPAHVVRALNVCRLARRVPARPPATVLPDYLRLPDAKPR